MTNILEQPDLNGFISTLILELHRLMRSKVTAYNETDSARKRFMFQVHPREVITDAMIQAWVRYSDQNPLIAHVKKHQTDFAIYKITDFMPIQQFRKTPLCHNTYSLMHAEYQMAMPFPIPGSAAVAVVFNRDVDFTERDRKLLSILQPAIFAAFRYVQRLDDLQTGFEPESADHENERGSKKLDDFVRRYKLSRQETRICRLLVAGRTNQFIAHQMELSVRTIEKYMERLLKKLDLGSRAEVMAKLLGKP